MILEATIIMALLGIFFSVVLSYFSKKFEVKVDSNIASVEAVLPHVNCGACGYPSCMEFAKAVCGQEAPFDGCKVGREPVAQKVKAVLDSHKNINE